MLSRAIPSAFSKQQQGSLVGVASRLMSSFAGTSSQIQPQNKVHVIGYPFAGGQGLQGPELSPGWLFRQEWLQNLEVTQGVSVEMVAVSNPKCNTSSDKDIVQGHQPGRKNWNNVINSSMRLERSTERALRHGLFPLVFGGDHSQAIGSVTGLKKVHPDAKVMWIDAHIDANTPASSPSSNMHGMPVAALAGLIPSYERKLVLSLKDLIYFGIRSYEPEELRMIQKHRIPWYDSRVCHPDRLPEMKKEIDKHFFPDGKRTPYWISFDIDGVDKSEFASTGTPEGEGISLAFMMKYLEMFLPEACGMDFTEVNFLQSDDEQAEIDMLTVRLLVEKVVQIVHHKDKKKEESKVRNNGYQYSKF